jgi:indolepyruvate ferredoxin oxidoreductase alpha subunit
MMDILDEKTGRQILLLGNEAITRGALEAGVDVATTYPGTPSSEIADTFSIIAKYQLKKGEKSPFHFEYATNEKVALEIAAAASFCGLRSLTCMKHVGMNVASDAFMSYLYVGCKGGHVIISADDPYCHSSQNEQDNRYYALFSGAPMLEPSTPQEAKEMTKMGFDISEELQLPILLRTTTRLNHARGPIYLDKIKKGRGKGHFKKDPMLVIVPAVARQLHPLLLKKIEKAEKISEKSPFNKIIKIGKPSNLGIVTSGVSFNYVKEASEDLNLNVKILKIGMTYPLPRKMCEDFIKSCKEIVFVEELEPILENDFKTIAFDIGSNVKIYGKSTNHFSRLYEYTPDIVAEALSKIFKAKNPYKQGKSIKSTIRLPNRPPALCPGCPHRVTYYAAKKASPKDTIFPTDIGCYTLGKDPPLEVADILLCMGSNVGTACGFTIATDQKVISFMGDSTFFHAGLPAIVDAVHHNHDFVITVLDNRTTAMTGHQPHPGTEFDGMGKSAKLVKVEDVVKGIGIEHVNIVNPKNIKKTIDAFKSAIEFKGPSVVISKYPCILLENRDKRKAGKKVPIFYVDQNNCTMCNNCITEFGCPAFYYGENNKVFIDEQQCNGCGVCIQICQSNAIKLKKEEVKK